jgi:hypothetical protein
MLFSGFVVFTQKKNTAIFDDGNPGKNNIFHKGPTNKNGLFEKQAKDVLETALREYFRGFAPSSKDLKQPLDFSVNIFLEPSKNGKHIIDFLGTVALSIAELQVEHDCREGKFPGLGLNFFNQRILLSTYWFIDRMIARDSFLETIRIISLSGAEIKQDNISLKNQFLSPAIASIMKFPGGQTALGFCSKKENSTATRIHSLLFHLILKNHFCFNLKFPLTTDDFFSKLYKDSYCFLRCWRFKGFSGKGSSMISLQLWKRFNSSISKTWKIPYKFCKLLNMFDAIDVFFGYVQHKNTNKLLREDNNTTPSENDATIFSLGIILTFKFGPVILRIAPRWDFKDKGGFNCGFALMFVERDSKDKFPIKNKSISKQMGSHFLQRCRTSFS